MKRSKSPVAGRAPRVAAVLWVCALAWLLGSCVLLRSHDPGARPEPVPGALHVVVMGDPHYPGKSPDRKQDVVRSINAWPDVALVAVVGDLVEDVGRPAAARSPLSRSGAVC